MDHDKTNNVATVANKGPEEILEQIKEISKMCKGKPFGVGRSKFPYM